MVLKIQFLTKAQKVTDAIQNVGTLDRFAHFFLRRRAEVN